MAGFDIDDFAWYPSMRGTTDARRAKKSNSKSTILKGAPKQSYEMVPEDHLFRLPPELRNQIYEHVIVADTHLPDDTRTASCSPTPKKRLDRLSDQAERQAPPEPALIKRPKAMLLGTDNEPNLLWVSPTIRAEALGMYYSYCDFRIHITIDQLESVYEWAAKIKEQHGRASNDFSPIHSIKLVISSFSWSDIGHLLPLARLYHLRVAHSWLVYKFKGRRLLCQNTFEEIQELGKTAAEEDWSEDWLGLKFEEWLEEKLDDKITQRGLKKGMKRLGREGLEPLRKGLPGDWYATDETGDGEGEDYNPHISLRQAGSSDRKLRSRE